MKPQMSSVSLDTLIDLPAPARRKIDAADVQVPDGSEVEPVVVGLSFPTALCFDEDGTLYSQRVEAPGTPARACRRGSRRSTLGKSQKS